jgi:hypothetical protein
MMTLRGSGAGSLISARYGLRLLVVGVELDVEALRVIEQEQEHGGRSLKERDSIAK